MKNPQNNVHSETGSSSEKNTHKIDSKESWKKRRQTYPGLVAVYVRPESRAGLFFQPKTLHGGTNINEAVDWK